MALKKDTYKGKSVFEKADLHKTATLVEFEGFKQTMFHNGAKTVKSTNHKEINQL